MRKSCSVLRIVLHMVVCFMMALDVAMGAPFKEQVPKEVKKVVKKQIKAYFGKQDIKGVPLLDPKIEWNDFANWPDEFKFGGETYSIRINESHLDMSIRLKSRTEVKPGMCLVVTYFKKGNGERGSLVLYGVWFKNGSINEKWVQFNTQTVFHCTYYTSGHILEFNLNECTTAETRREFYDRNSKLVGFSVEPNGKSGRSADYVWEGRKVDVKSFQEKFWELYTKHLWNDPEWNH